jgi:hypothetical protein
MRETAGIFGFVPEVAESALNPARVESAIRDWRRAGLPGQSIPAGSGGKISTGRLLKFDTFDAALSHAWVERYCKPAFRIVELARTMQRVENSLLVVAPPLPDPEPCVTCGREMDDGRSECAACRMRRSRERPFGTNICS